MGSDYKNEIIRFIKSVNNNRDIAFAKKVSNGVYADIYFSDIHCAIIFHSIENAWRDKKVKINDTHQPEQIIKFVHLWEDQWIFHEPKIRSMLKSLMGITKRIHGRETKLIPIDNSQLLQFLDVNHLNVPIKAKYKYGLFKNLDLVAVMSFSKSRKIVREDVVFNSYELLRFCNKLDVTVVGGFSKLLHYFLKMHTPDDVMTYVDCDWSDGRSLMGLGFEFSQEKPAMEFWLNINTGKREYPHLILNKLKKSLHVFESETEKNAFLTKNGYVRVYNSGSYKLILKRKIY
jgi:hypothetical protein